MSDRVFWMLFVLAAVGLAVVLAVINCAIDAACRRHFRRAQQMPLPPQISHVRTVPNPRQEISQ
jgi:hypothetical protein